MAEHPETIMEETETLMISPKGGKPTSKMAHFIKPIINSTDSIPEIPSTSLSSRPISLKCTFNGWRNPTHQWNSWVDRLHSSYQYIWKSAGIYDSILSSKYKIIKNEDLFFGLAERWCCDTNTFVFPWGEASITLEDVVVLGGYSVLGDSVSCFVDNKQFADIETRLLEHYQVISRRCSRKANQGVWMKHFMAMGGDSGIEHEAFISLWLSRFVLPSFPYDAIVERFFKIAICLARGVQIAIAPVVLASVYRDLSLLKSGMISCCCCSSSNKVKESGKDDGFDDLIMVTLWAPLQLVQVWAWERFKEFRSKPSLIECGEPRLARWHGVNEKEIGNVRPLLQSAGHTFEWRPYCRSVDNIAMPSFYRENEEWVIVGDGLDDDTKALVRFLRVCELVGMDTIERYNPNRVAMQFGFDQDVPKQVKRDLMVSDIPRRELVQLAWFSYINPIRDEILFVPSKLYEPLVTIRYLKWLRQGVLTRQVLLDGIVRKKRSNKRARRSQECRNVKYVIDKSIADFDVDVKPSSMTSSIGKDLDVPPGFLPKYNVATKLADVPLGFTQKNNNNVGHLVDVPPGFMPKTICNKPDVPPGFPRDSKVGHDVDVPPVFVSTTNGNNNLDDVPPGFPPKSNGKATLCVVKLESEVKVKNEYTGSVDNGKSPAELRSKREESMNTKDGGGSGKNEWVMPGVETKSGYVHGETTQTIAPQREEKIDGCSDRNEKGDLVTRIRKLEMMVAELTQARSDKLS